MRLSSCCSGSGKVSQNARRTGLWCLRLISRYQARSKPITATGLGVRGAVGGAAVNAAGVADQHVPDLHQQLPPFEPAALDSLEASRPRHAVAAVGDLEGAVLAADVDEREVDGDQRRRRHQVRLLREEGGGHVAVPVLVDAAFRRGIAGVLNHLGILAEELAHDPGDAGVPVDPRLVEGGLERQLYVVAHRAAVGVGADLPEVVLPYRRERRGDLRHRFRGNLPPQDGVPRAAHLGGALGQLFFGHLRFPHRQPGYRSETTSDWYFSSSHSAPQPGRSVGARQPSSTTGAFIIPQVSPCFLRASASTLMYS